MINLVTPIIDGPLSDLSTLIHLTGCLPGATVEIRALNRATVVKMTVGSGEPWVSLIPGELLVGGDQLVARQYLTDGSGDESAETPANRAFSVAAAPVGSVGLGPVDILGQLWECGQFVWGTGAFPGATVEVLWGATTVPKGQGFANGNAARFRLGQPFPADEIIQVLQRTPSGQGPIVTRQVQRLPPEDQTQLRPPVIQPPLRDCQTAVLVKGVFEGAEVVLTRKSGQEDRAGFDLAELWFNLSHPLDLGDVWISARQEMLRCERKGVSSSPVNIDPAVTPRTPIINTHICIGSTRIQVAALEPGAEVQITNGSSTFRGSASAASVQDFEIPPAMPGTVSVIQLLCGMASAAATAPVDPQPISVTPPQIESPLYRCARTVQVHNAHPGAMIQIWAKGTTLGTRPISTQIVAATVDVTVNVTPFLWEGDDVWVLEWPCGLEPIASPSSPVLALPQVLDPRIAEPVTRLASAVVVHQTIKGAAVEVLRQRRDLTWEIIGTAWATGPSTSVPLAVTLSNDQKLRPRQRICEIETKESPIVTVVKPAPLPPVLVTPPNGANVPRNSAITLSWTDPGASLDRKADTFDVTVVGGATSPFVPAVVGLSATVPATQTTKFNANFSWSVVARNSTGTATATSTFHTPPAPPPMFSARRDGNNIKCEGSGFVGGHQVEISIHTDYSSIQGSPSNPVQVVDNRSGVATTIAKADGTIDASLTPENVLELRVVIENGVTQSYKSAPFPGADMTARARNTPPISPSDGSPNWSADVKFKWN